MAKKKQISRQVMELKDLISGPLVATIDADSISAHRYLNYLFELAFESYDYKTGKAGALRMLEFTYGASGDTVHTIKIPLLTLVPLPLLQIHEADFDFDIQIIDAIQEDRNATFRLSKHDEDDSEVTKGESKQTDGLKLRVAMAPQTTDNVKRHSQSSLTANMKVNVKMHQADMPGGLMKLLQLTTNNAVEEERKPIEQQQS